MNGTQLTKAHQFWPLTDYLKGRGVPIGRYIERFRMPKKMLDVPEMYVDEARFWQLAGDVAQREGLLDWGFRAGKQLELGVLGEFGTKLLRQPSLKAALEVFVVTIRAEASRAHFDLMDQGETVWWILQGHRNAPAGMSVIELYNMQFMIKLVQSGVGTCWLPPAIHLQCDSLPEGLTPTKICTGRIRFSSTMTAIAIPRELMAEPMTGHRSSIATDICSQTPPLAPPVDFETSLRMLLTGYLDEGLTIDEFAELVGTSGRTLQRRLAGYGTTFKRLLEQTRFDIAKQLLQDESINILDICYELGYTDPGNFTRAFRRWAGVSPRRHRQLLRPIQ